MAVAAPPSFLMALAILIPPPPGSSFGVAHTSFFSGTKAATAVLLSIQGLNVMVMIDDITQIKNY